MVWNGLYGIYLPGGRYLFRSVLIGILVASFTLGSFPAGVGAYQLSQLRQDLVSALSGAALAQADMDAELQRMNDTMASNASSAEPAVPMPLNAEFETGGGYPQPEVGHADTHELEEPAIAESEPKDQEAGGGSLDNSAGTESQEPAQGDGEGGVDIADDAAVPDSMTSAEQDASAIEGAEVLQQGDGEKSGNVLLADRAAVDALGGRDFAGQVVKEIGGRKYILIGNEQQLRAIGSGKKVHTAVYQAVLSGVHWEVDKDKDGNPIMLYSGDADLLASQNGTKDYILGEIDKDHGALRGRCGVNQETGKIDPTMDIEASGVSYAADANYIIFRDIDLGTNAADSTNTGWTPLMFSSIMLGAKSDAPTTAGSLWGCIKKDGSGVADVAKVANPVISNVNVVGTGELSIAKQSGVGFFGTISNKHDDKDIFASPARATVSNITLDGVVVDNQHTGVRIDTTLVNELAGLLGGLVGGLLDIVLGLLGLDGPGKLVEQLLTIRKNDPSSLATGGFAGRIVGDVEVSGCEVHAVSVSSRNAMTGGFAGYVQGETLYGPVSGLSGTLVEVLAGLLNIVPGVGLGDVITLLLGKGNLLDVSELVPQDYLNPVISHCSVRDFVQGESIGSAAKDYAGGFAGIMTGAVAQDCSVESANTYTVTADLFAGGFAGLMRNDAMKGALSELGVQLVRDAQPQSAAAGCTVASDITVTAASYAGGFTGAMANSFAVDASVGGTVDVTATGHEEDHDGKRSIKALAGGFTGTATLGWITSLGNDKDKEGSLLSGVSGLLNGLLGGTSEDKQNLLSLVGVRESKLLGVHVAGDVSVASANDFAGGLVGKGDGVVIAASDEAHMKDIKLWSENVLTHTPSGRGCAVEGLRSVKAAKSYAGGIAGFLGTAHAGGLINNTLGLADFLPFSVSSVTVTGVADGFTVTAGDTCAAAGIGKATGGKIGRADKAYGEASAAPATSVVAISNIKSVTAKNNAAGFAGAVGPGELVTTGGLDLLGLGLLQANGLLGVGAGLEVKMDGVTVSGVPAGMEIAATGTNAEGQKRDYTAAGFIASANSAEVTDGHVANLASVSANTPHGVAGGFVGTSRTGGLAEVSDADAIKGLITDGGGLIQIDNLLNAVGYLVPNYTNVDVSFINGGSVKADIAGGFAGDFQSGELQNGTGKPWAVYNIAKVEGGAYAGGFGGKVTSGALAAADGGVSILGGLSLNIGIDGLLGVLNAYVPTIENAGVKSDASTVEATSGASLPDQNNSGLVVEATSMDALDSQSGSAGGYIGYGSGVQVSNCDVTHLRHTGVTEPKKLEGTDGSAYFDRTKSTYAVKAPRYAGGFMGKMDVGSAASVGNGLNVLGQTIQLTDIASALSVVVSTIEHSDVNGGAGGFAVLASEAGRANDTVGGGAADPGSKDNPVGSAGGFVGEVKGGHIQDSNSYNFSYVVGQVSAGGYAGTIAPGDVASVLADNTSILKGLVSTNGALASLLQDFVPTIRNSKTACVPCGGAVRAQAASDEFVQRGMAGGYVGHNEGGHIWGMNNAPWKEENDTSNHYTGTVEAGTKRRAVAERIRSVYGAEIAGGYTGLLEPADTAKVGSLSLLFGLVKADNLLGALEVSYPTQENSEVTGPLRGIGLDTWNAWVQHVGAQGGYGAEFAGKTFATQKELDAFIAGYVFGTNVVAGRSQASSKSNETRGGIAGGYVGLMHGGAVTHGQATDTKLVSALRAAGGFAGSMETADAVSLGGIEILGLNLNLGNLLSALDVLVPAVKSSSVTGYRKGMTVRATGTDASLEQGYAGGYVGYASGAQIWGDATFADANKDGDRWTAGATHEGSTASGCNVQNLRKVAGANCIGGFAGIITAAGVADVNTNNTSSGLLQKLLDKIISKPQSVASVLSATVSTVRGASVSAVDEGAATAAAGTADGSAVAATSAWGFTVEGAYGDAGARQYARAAGGFVGLAKAVVLGTQDGGKTAYDTVSVRGLRGVEGGQYAGGFVGQADVTGVASIAGGTDGDQSTKLLLKLIKAGNISAVEAFRPYFYHASVDGVADGFQVRAHDSSTQGILNAKQFTGTAGGFAGSVVNGSVKNCAVTDLMSVSGVNYTGGFVGHLGKAGTVDADSAKVNGILGATAGVLDVWGAHVERSSVVGVSGGYTVSSTHYGADYGAATDGAKGREVAGGFVGYADLARVLDCDAGNLKLVTSGEIAGGFAGEARRASLVDLEATSPLLDFVLKVVNLILNILYVGNLQDLGVINLGEWFGAGKIFDIKLLADGSTAYVNLFGLKIGVALSKKSDENQQQTDVAIITIGDSVVKLPCTKGTGVDINGDRSELTAQLIKANRARVEDCSVTGVTGGYDVFGGSASQEADGTVDLATGYAGGFSGLNDEGVLYHNDMYYADVVRGTAEKVDPFANTKLKSAWDFNSMEDIVGPDDENNYNVYRVYRKHVDGATATVTKGNALITRGTLDTGEGTANTGLDRYDVQFFHTVNCFDQDIANSDAAGDVTTKWIGMKGAQRTGESGFTEDLGVYESASKAVLMLDTAQAGNDGVLTPEPDEGQDPCAAQVDITIQKVWNDAGDKEGKRPQSIAVKLEAFYVDGKGNQVTPNKIVVSADGVKTEVKNPQIIELSAADASDWTDTWRKVVSGLPVAFTDEHGQLHYYSYRVTEVSATFADGTSKSLAEAGYTVTYGAETVDHAITITNTDMPVLPETGGKGIWLAVAAGGMLLAWGAYERRRKSMACAGYVPTHAASRAAGLKAICPNKPRHARRKVSPRRR